MATLPFSPYLGTQCAARRADLAAAAFSEPVGSEPLTGRADSAVQRMDWSGAAELFRAIGKTDPWMRHRGGIQHHRSTNGMSINLDVVNGGVWRIIWNDDNGVLDPDSRRILAANTLYKVSPDAVSQTCATSADRGQIWTVRSDGRCVRRARTETP